MCSTPEKTDRAFRGSTHSSNNLASDDINVPCYLLAYAENGIQLISHLSLQFISCNLLPLYFDYFFPINYISSSPLSGIFVTPVLPISPGVLSTGQDLYKETNTLAKFYQPSPMICNSRELPKTWTSI